MSILELTNCCSDDEKEVPFSCGKQRPIQKCRNLCSREIHGEASSSKIRVALEKVAFALKTSYHYPQKSITQSPRQSRPACEAFWGFDPLLHTGQCCISEGDKLPCKPTEGAGSDLLHWLDGLPGRQARTAGTMFVLTTNTSFDSCGNMQARTPQ